MDPRQYHSVIQDSSNGVSYDSSIPSHISYNMLNAGTMPLSNSHSLSGVFAPDMNGQGISYGELFTSGDFTYPIMNSNNPTYLSQPLSDNNSLANPPNFPGGSVERHNPSSTGFRDFERQWSGFPSAGFQANSYSTGETIPTLQTPYYLSATAQPLSSNQTQSVSATHGHGTVQPAYSEQEQFPTNNTANTQSTPRGSHPHGQSGSSMRQSRQSENFPQSGASAGPSQQRRHARTQSLASTGSVSSGPQQARHNTQNSRSRARPARHANVSSHGQSSSASSHNHTHQVQTSSAPNTHSPSSRTRGSRIQLSQLSAQQEDQLLRSLQLRTLLRNMQTDGTQALRMYEESLLQGLRYPPESEVFLTPSSPKDQEKDLDTPSESCPEPKETEELTVNLECRICMSQLIDTVILPCGHAILCRWCADQHIPSKRGHPKGQATCPMCRTPVKKKYRIYMS